MARDLTGSGKTIAFTLPIVERLRSQQLFDNKSLKAMVLTPTRELALQIARVFESLKHDEEEFTVLTVYGGIGFERQMNQLQTGCDIVVGTTGRCKDFIERSCLGFKDL
jgi:ATP-dependent RNA helicase DeaD